MKALQKYLFWLFHGVFFVLFVLAVIHYKERLFADSAYFFFHSVNSEWFHIEHNRLLLGLSQVFPVVGSWLNLPLKYLLLSYSLGVELIYYLLFLLLLYKLKDKAGAIALVLTHLIGQLWLFHVPSLEICHGAALTIVLYSILKSNRATKDDKWFIFLLLIEWLILFAHPANLLFLPFVVLLDVVNRSWQKKIHYSLIGFFAVGVLIRYANMSEYDAAHLNEGVKSSDLPFFQLGYWSRIVEVFTSYYPELISFGIITLVVLLLKRKIKKIAVFIAAIFGVLACTAWLKNIDSFYFYTEAILSVFSGAVIFFFAYELWGILNEKWRTFLLLVVLAISVERIVWIESFGKKFENRKEQLDQLVDYAQGTYKGKLIIREENFQKSYSLMNWANPIETLIFSAIDGKEGTVSIISESDLNFENNKGKLSDSTYMLRRFDVLPLSSLNEKYFHLPKGKYQSLNSNSSVDFNSLKTEVKIDLDENLRFPKADTITTSVKITNNADQVIPSSKASNVFLASHWYYEDGNSYKWDGYRNLLEVDIKGNYQQEILIKSPAEAGIYYLQPDIVVEGKLWFQLKPKVKVEVY